MLKALEDLQVGLMTPQNFNSEVKLRNCLDLSLAKHVSYPTLDSRGVTAMDIELVEERYLLYGGKNGTVAVFDLENTSKEFPYNAQVEANIRPSFETHKACITRIQWYPFDTGMFITSSKSNNLKIWDTNAMEAVDSMNYKYHVMSHDMSSIATRHTLIAVATSYPTVQLYDIKSGCTIQELKGHEVGIEAVKWSPRADNLLATGGSDNRILLWDIRSSKGFLKCLDQHNLSSTSAIGNKSLEYKYFGNKSTLPTAHKSRVTGLKFTDDGLYLVSRSADEEVVLWDVALAKNTLVNYGIPLRKNYKFRNLPFAFDICSDAKVPLVFLPSNNFINIYGVHTGMQYANLVGHFCSVNCCVFRPSYHELYSGGCDGNVIAWAAGENGTLSQPVNPCLENQDDADAWSDNSD